MIFFVYGENISPKILIGGFFQKSGGISREQANKRRVRPNRGGAMSGQIA
jgi:hypothetical protein